MKLVEVYWTDAAFIMDEDESTLEAWLEDGGMNAKTVGYLLDSNDKCVIVYAEHFFDGTKRGITVIPRGMISKIREIANDVS